MGKLIENREANLENFKDFLKEHGCTYEYNKYLRKNNTCITNVAKDLIPRLYITSIVKFTTLSKQDRLYWMEINRAWNEYRRM
jgi:hypothetical protein